MSMSIYRIPLDNLIGKYYYFCLSIPVKTFHRSFYFSILVKQAPLFLRGAFI